jgi:hypothetical protein
MLYWVALFLVHQTELREAPPRDTVGSHLRSPRGRSGQGGVVTPSRGAITQLPQIALRLLPFLDGIVAGGAYTANLAHTAISEGPERGGSGPSLYYSLAGRHSEVGKGWRMRFRKGLNRHLGKWFPLSAEAQRVRPNNGASPVT